MAAKKKSPSKATKRPVKAKKNKATPAKRVTRKAATPKSRPLKRSAGKRPAPKKKAPLKRGTAKRVPKAPKVPQLPEAPEALKLARAIAEVALAKKALEVIILDTRARSSAVGYDYVVLASGESDRQLAAIHEGVDEVLKPQGQRAAAVEASPDWVCVTYDEGVVAHFFTPDKRELMDLEGMWAGAPRVS